jgi:hypothetical protein
MPGLVDMHVHLAPPCHSCGGPRQLRDASVKAVFATPYKRTQQTAGIVAEALGPRGQPLSWAGRTARLLTAEAAKPTGRGMSDTPPDRLSLDPRSPHFDEDKLKRGVGIRFNGVEKTNVEEYSISEGWIRVAAGKSRDRYGNPMTVKLKGSVEPYYERPADDEEGSAA